MSEPEHTNAVRHVIGMVAGMVAIVLSVASPGGIGGYLTHFVVSAVAVILGHSAVRRRGPFWWMALSGLVLSYFALIMAVGLITIRLMRLFLG